MTEDFSILTVIRLKKLIQIVQCLCQNRDLFFIQRLNNSFYHLLMKIRMMMICLLPFFRQLDIDDPPVFFAPVADCILFIDQTVPSEVVSESDRDSELLRDRGHIIPSPKSDCFNNMHIVIRQILEFFCDHCLFF